MIRILTNYSIEKGIYALLPILLKEIKLIKNREKAKDALRTSSLQR
jgi:hypothetical protein